MALSGDGKANMEARRPDEGASEFCRASHCSDCRTLLSSKKLIKLFPRLSALGAIRQKRPDIMDLIQSWRDLFPIHVDEGNVLFDLRLIRTRATSKKWLKVKSETS